MLKNSFVRYTLILGVICLVASVLLSVVYSLTRPKILYQKALEEQESLKDVLPAADSFEPVKEGEEVVYYKALDKEKKVLGYAFKTSRKGYSSDIVTMVGIDPSGVIANIKILSQNETPGLGTRVTEVIQKETLWDVVLRQNSKIVSTHLLLDDFLRIDTVEYVIKCIINQLCISRNTFQNTFCFCPILT